MKSCFLLVIAAILPATVSGQPTPLSSAGSERAVYALAAWFESDDFDADQLASVVSYGQSVVPSLIAALNAGPSPARRERLRISLDEGYSMLAAQVRDKPDGKLRSKKDYIKHYMENFEVSYRVRAAQALAAIGGPEARKALQAALGKAARSDVRSALQQSLKEIK